MEKHREFLESPSLSMSLSHLLYSQLELEDLWGSQGEGETRMNRNALKDAAATVLRLAATCAWPQKLSKMESVAPACTY